MPGTDQRRLLQQYTTEAEVQRGCREWLRAKGVYCWRQNTAGIYDQKTGRYYFHGLRGVSDILGVLPASSVYPGRILCVECKRPGGKLSPEQEAFQDAISANGGIACWVSSVDELEADLGPLIDGTDSGSAGTPGGSPPVG